MTVGELDDLDRQTRDLADLLRSLRKASGLTGDRLAARTAMSQSKVSKIETGRVLPSIMDVERILAALEVPVGVRDHALTLARTANMNFNSWRAVRRLGLQKKQHEIAAIEEAATSIRYFQCALVPGLLQTPEYARAVLSLPRLAGDTDPRQATATRIERQRILYDERKHFTFIITEAALRARICSEPVTFTQFEHIATLSRLRNVTVGLIPWAVRLPDVPSNAFVLFDDRLVTVETFSGELVLRDPRDIALHIELLEQFAQVAAWDEEMRAILSTLSEECQ
jgi:transcriptional regulator with XRE-family HTH domain